MILYIIITKDEWLEVITNCDNRPENIKYSPSLPFAFTEKVVAMLSSVLKSKRALYVNVFIVKSLRSLTQICIRR